LQVENGVVTAQNCENLPKSEKENRRSAWDQKPFGCLPFLLHINNPVANLLC
jgi:hypothetical protein